MIRQKRGDRLIKVLNIITDSNFGGAGRVLLQCLKCFDREAFDIVVVLPRESALKPYVEQLGYRVIETKCGRDRSLDLRAIREYKRIIRAEKPDIVHTHSSFSGKLAAWLCNIPGRVSTRHCVLGSSPKLTRFPGKQINGLINNTLSTHIIAVADAAKEVLTETGVDPKRITVILNGVEALPVLSPGEIAAFREKYGVGKDDLLGLISARLEPYKGHADLLEAVSMMKSINVKVMILGKGSCEEALKKQAKELGIEDRVLFAGFASDIVPFNNAADFLLNSSHSEATSMALAEGMSLGKPAIVTDVGGNPRMIREGVNGLIVPAHAPPTMAAAIDRFAADPALRARLSAGAAEEYRRNFTSRVMTDRIEALYRSAVK